jgi:uracil-DNA glycosylase family 4
LRRYCADVASRGKPEFAGQSYWGRPLPGLGDADARLLIVGLAPAAHGGNRTGRMFTGDGSAAWLARALYRAGFATLPSSVKVGDGFALRDAFITAALRCAPPLNKPTLRQMANCAPFMRAELEVLQHLRVAVALGKIAFDTLLARLRERGFEVPVPRPKFGHGLELSLAWAGRKHPLTLLTSYHPSRQNTNTGKLTQQMLDEVFMRARALLETQGQRAVAAHNR